MAIDRRQLLIGSLLALSARSYGHAIAASEEPAFVAAAKVSSETYAVILLGSDGSILRQIPLQARGHDIALHLPSRRAVAFARRPGSFAVAFDIDGLREPTVFSPADDRHFYGHGTFSADGRLLYVTENDDDQGRGVVGIYDVAARFRRIGEFESYGIGPHEALLLRDGRTLAIANGGLDTTAETGRQNLNVTTMQPSLAFINVNTGDLIERHALHPSLHKLSIRHLAADARGAIWFGGQWEGDASDTPELIGSAGIGRAIKLITPSKSLAGDLKGYVGSMSATPDGEIIAASSPRGGRIVYVNAADGHVCGEQILPDGCGIAGLGEHRFAATSGLGVFRIEGVSAPLLTEKKLADIAFDNHLRSLKR